MTRIALFILSILFSISSLAKDKKGNAPKQEDLRAQFHYSTDVNRMGSPISLIELDSVFHLYYQYNPFNLKEGFINWGHAVSHDLIHWQEKDIVLKQPADVSDSLFQAPWWGTAFTDKNETKALFCKWGEGIYSVSKTDGELFLNEKKVNLDEVEKCEPYVFFHKKSSKWVMFNYNVAKSEMQIYTSSNLENWAKTSSFNFKFGKPQIFELEVDRKPDDTRIVLLTDDGKYALVTFDGEEFNFTKTLSYFDYGKACGGTIVFQDKTKKRTITFSELKSKQHADLPCNGVLSFPSEIVLHDTGEGVELLRKPIEELKQLFDKTTTWENKKIYPGLKNNLLGKVKGTKLHMKGTIDLKNCDDFSIIFRCDRNMQGTELSYNVKREMINLENINLEYKPKNNKLQLEILIDQSTIEVYLEGGRYVMSTSFFPEPNNTRYELVTKGGEINVDHFEVTSLKSIWHEE